MRNLFYIFVLAFSLFLLGCRKQSNDIDTSIENSTKTELPSEPKEEPEKKSGAKEIYKILALGDSYTIGQSVCTTCNFPQQLKLMIEKECEIEVDLKIIAKTGWTTTNLKNAIPKEHNTHYDFVTLLIGVNNQFQGINFKIYKKEFSELLTTAVKAAKGNKKNVVVLSIPDYAFTPFGNGNTKISKDLKVYNAFAKQYCNTYGVDYLYITDITEKGLEQPELVANDGLHPSKIAYAKFVQKLYPIFLETLK